MNDTTQMNPTRVGKRTMIMRIKKDDLFKHVNSRHQSCLEAEGVSFFFKVGFPKTKGYNFFKLRHIFILGNLSNKTSPCINLWAQSDETRSIKEYT